MTKDEKRLHHLISDPDDDAILEEDIALLRAGILHLNWTDTPEGRLHPFVTSSPVAAKYLERHGRLSPAHRRTLRELANITRKDVEWAKENIQHRYH